MILTYGIGPELAQISNGMAKLGWTRCRSMGTSWPLPRWQSVHRYRRQANGNGVIMPQTFIEDKTQYAEAGCLPQRLLQDAYKA